MTERRIRKITPTLEKEILEKAAQGESSRTIAAWIGAERGVKVTFQAVARLLRHTKTVRADVAQAVVRETLGKTVLGDLDKLGREQDRMERLARKLHRRANAALEDIEKAAGGEDVDQERMKVAILGIDTFLKGAMQATDRVARLAALKLRLSGADPDDADADSELRDASQRVSARIAGVAAGIRARAGTS